jgi:hypothetical protein
MHALSVAQPSGEVSVLICSCGCRPTISRHMKQALAPILFYDNDKPAAAAKRADPSPPNAPIPHWPKPRAKRTDDDTPVHSFTSLLANLATICANQIQPADDMPEFTVITSLTPLQRQVVELLAVSPPRLRVVTNPHQTNHKTQANTQQRQPNRRNFGLAGIDTFVAEPGGAVEQHLGLLPLLRRVAVEPPVGGPLVGRSPTERSSRPAVAGRPAPGRRTAGCMPPAALHPARPETPAGAPARSAPTRGRTRDGDQADLAGAPHPAAGSPAATRSGPKLMQTSPCAHQQQSWCRQAVRDLDRLRP